MRPRQQTAMPWQPSSRQQRRPGGLRLRIFRRNEEREPDVLLAWAPLSRYEAAAEEA